MENMEKKKNAEIQRVRPLNFDFTGALGQELTDEVEVDTGYDRIIGIELLSTYYADPSEIVSFDFDGKKDKFPRGLLGNFFQDKVVPVNFDNMELKKVNLTLKNNVAAARKVQVVLYLEKSKKENE
jgi:hypothetical protein